MSRCNYCGSESVYSNALKICPQCFNYLKEKDVKDMKKFSTIHWAEDIVKNNKKWIDIKGTAEKDWWKKQVDKYCKDEEQTSALKKHKAKVREIKLTGVILTIQAGIQEKDPDIILVSVRSKTAIKELQKNLGCKIKIIAKPLPRKVVDAENWQPEEKKRRMLRIE